MTRVPAVPLGVAGVWPGSLRGRVEWIGPVAAVSSLYMDVLLVVLFREWLSR